MRDMGALLLLYPPSRAVDHDAVRFQWRTARLNTEVSEQVRRQRERTQRILLDARGFLAFCPTDWNYGSTVSDYRATTIRETWQGNFYRRLREAHVSGDFSGHGFCGQCPDWQVTRWPGEGAILMALHTTTRTAKATEMEFMIRRLRVESMLSAVAVCS